MSQPCGCCSGVQIITPVLELNRPGLTTISYRAGTYATFFESMVARLSSLYLDVPNADHRSTQRIYPLRGLTTRDLSDPSIALLDAWAIVADVLTFYQERIANEGYLPTATERVSLLELARLVGYRLRPGVASTVYLAFTAATAFRGIIPAGTRAQSIPGPGQQPQYFETSDDLNAREEWNAIHPRLTRSQIIAPGGIAGIDPATLHTLYFQGQTTNLKPGDGIIITTNDVPTSTAAEGQMLRIVDEVNPQPDERRTQVVLRERTPAQAPTLVAVVQRYLSESSILFPGSTMAAQVAALLAGALSRSSAAISVTSLRSLLQQLVQLESIADSRGFSRLKAWLNDLIEDFTSVARLGTFATQTAASIALPDPGTLVTHSRAPASSVLSNLGQIIGTLSQPPSAQPADSLSLTRTVGQAFAPQSDLAPQLLQAFHPQAASSLYQAWANIALAPSSVRVYAARAKATLFASNFAGAATSIQIPPVTGGPQAQANTGIQTLTSFTPPVLADAVSDLIDNNNVRLNAVPLDATYEQIKVGSWVAIDRPNPDGTRTVTTHQVTGVQTVARETGQASPTGFAAKVTQLTLNPAWLSDLSPAEFKTALQSTPLLRGTAIYGQTEVLSLAEEPLDRDVSGNTIELDGLYDGLQSGRWVVVTGERTDIPNTTGVQVNELVMIAAVEQGGSGQQSCMSFNSSILAFDNVFYVTPPNAAGDRLVVGQPGSSFLNLLNLTPLPNQPGHQPICGTFQLAPGLYANAYLPTASERTGDFSDFSATLIDPFPGASPAITNGIIPPARINGNNAVFAWRISAIASGADTVHTTLVLANSLAYTYDSATVSISANVVEATQGQTVGEVLGNGDGSEGFQSFALHQKPLTYVPAATPEGVQTTLDVKVNEVDWKEVDSFAALGPNDHGYITQTDDQDRTTVIFGNGDYGARVPTGTANIKATYRYGIGSSGNVAAGAISQLATHPLGAQAVTNPLPATGGADRDSILQARTNTPIAVMALDRLVSIRDYADFSRNFAGISKAAAAKLSDGRRQLVHITIAGAGDAPIDPSDQLYQSLVASLHKFGDPLQPILVGIRKVKLLVMSAGIRVQSGYHFETVEPAVRATLLDAFSFGRRSLGQSVFLSEAIGLIQSIRGVDYCNVTVFDSVAEDIDTNGLAALAGSLRRRSVVRANLAGVDRTQSIVSGAPIAVQQLWKRFTPAELAFLTPAIADTLILTEITAGNPGPPPALRAGKLRKVNGSTSIIYMKAPQEGSK